MKFVLAILLAISSIAFAGAVKPSREEWKKTSKSANSKHLRPMRKEPMRKGPMYHTRCIRKGKFGTSLGDVVVNSPFLSTLELALETASLLDFFFCEADGVTVFAPTDEAFAAIDQTILMTLLEPGWILHLQSILLTHVVDAVVPSNDVRNDAVIPTLSGSSITAIVGGGEICFEPTITLDLACVDEADVRVANGIAHVIDDVLAPSWVETNIVDVAVDAGAFTALAEALACTELLDTVATSLGLTVFAPTDDAFAEAGIDVSAMCMSADGRAALTDVLLYHVIDAVIPSVAIEKGISSAQTLQTQFVTITNCPNFLMVEESNVITTDIIANNGIIHVIDAVLFPPTDGMAKNSFGRGERYVCGERNSYGGRYSDGGKYSKGYGKGSSYSHGARYSDGEKYGKGY